VPRVAAEKREGTSKRGDGTREAILEAAQVLFCQNGFARTSLASVAKAVSMSQPGLLHHFPSKEALLLAVLAERDSSDTVPAEAIEQGTGIPTLARFSALVEENQLHPEHRRLMSVLLGEAVTAAHPAKSYFVQRYEGLRSEISAELQHLHEDGVINADHDLEAVATLLIAVLDGLQYQFLLDQSVDRQRCFEVFRNIINQVLLSPDGKAPREQTDG
jgi:AcrR family transcriptional regulator